jgi:hypothetical protein
MKEGIDDGGKVTSGDEVRDNCPPGARHCQNLSLSQSVLFPLEPNRGPSSAVGNASAARY